MREIICRGKRKDGGGWVIGRLLGEHVIAPRGQTLYIDSRRNKFSTENNTELECFIVEEETVGQYIGIDDTDGEQLFEGDIVEMKLEYDIVIGGHIEYRGAAFRVSTGADLWDINNYYTLKKLGNIYDNPELLKGE